MYIGKTFCLFPNHPPPVTTFIEDWFPILHPSVHNSRINPSFRRKSTHKLTNAYHTIITDTVVVVSGLSQRRKGFFSFSSYFFLLQLVLESHCISVYRECVSVCVCGFRSVNVVTLDWTLRETSCEPYHFSLEVRLLILSWVDFSLSLSFKIPKFIPK